MAFPRVFACVMQEVEEDVGWHENFGVTVVVAALVEFFLGWVFSGLVVDAGEVAIALADGELG